MKKSKTNMLKKESIIVKSVKMSNNSSVIKYRAFMIRSLISREISVWLL